MHTIKTLDMKQAENIRSAIIDGRAWFVGNDAAKALGYKDPSRAVRRLVRKEHTRRDTCAYRDSRGRLRFPVMIDESGMFSLSHNRHLPDVKQLMNRLVNAGLPTNFRYEVNAHDSERFPLYSAIPFSLCAYLSPDLYDLAKTLDYDD